MKSIPLRFLLASSFTACAPALLPAQPAPFGAPATVISSHLLVAPTRVVLEGRVRSMELTLINTGDDPGTYRISLAHMKMAETGEVTPAEPPAPDDLVADALVRFSPRQVTIAPHESQTVRIQVRKPSDLEPGEYRSHLLFRVVPPATPAVASPVPGAAPASEFSIQLKPLVGVSIPLIVRHGDLAATVALTGAKLAPATGGEPAGVEFRIERQGNRSVYGDLRMTYLPVSGRAVVVGVVNGLAVYTPNPDRLVRMALRAPPEVVIGHGRIAIAYSEEGGGKPLASATLDLP